MQKLYLDCDGVILDTINKSYQMIKEKGLTKEEVNDFYQNINWDEFGISPNKLYKVTWKYKISSDPDHFIEV